MESSTNKIDIPDDRSRKRRAKVDSLLEPPFFALILQERESTSAQQLPRLQTVGGPVLDRLADR